MDVPEKPALLTEEEVRTIFAGSIKVGAHGGNWERYALQVAAIIERAVLSRRRRKAKTIRNLMTQEQPK